MFCCICAIIAIEHDFVIHLDAQGQNLGFRLGFQHFPRDLANVNEWKIMFDPSINEQVKFESNFNIPPPTCMASSISFFNYH